MPFQKSFTNIFDYFQDIQTLFKHNGGVMKNKQRTISLAVILVFSIFAATMFLVRPNFENKVSAENLTAMNSSDDFNQTEALAKLREQIKGREKEPAETVFKNIQTLKGVPAGRLLAIMEFGYSRSLGVNCTHCHTPENWSSEDKNKKQITRDMAAMAANINNQMLKNIKNIGEKIQKANAYMPEQIENIIFYLK